MADTVTFEMPSGSQVTCSPELAKKLGYTGSDKKTSTRSSKSE